MMHVVHELHGTCHIVHATRGIHARMYMQHMVHDARHGHTEALMTKAHNGRSRNPSMQVPFP